MCYSHDYMKTRNLVFIALFVALMTAGAFLRIPLPFISVTFQLFFALLAGIILGPVKGLIAMAVYMAIGLMGIPVFSLGGGPSYVLQPSFGFILGFLPAAYFSGLAYKNLQFDERASAYISYISGMLASYIIGIPYLYIIMRFYSGNTDTTLAAVTVSMLIYALKDAVLGIVLIIFAGRIPMLRKLAGTQVKSP